MTDVTINTNDSDIKAYLQQVVGELYDQATDGLIETFAGGERDGETAFDARTVLINTVLQFARRTAHFRDRRTQQQKERAVNLKKLGGRSAAEWAVQALRSAVISDQNAQHWMRAAQAIEDEAVAYGIPFDVFVPNNAIAASDDEYEALLKALEHDKATNATRAA